MIESSNGQELPDSKSNGLANLVGPKEKMSYKGYPWGAEMTFHNAKTPKRRGNKLLCLLISIVQAITIFHAYICIYITSASFFYIRFLHNNWKNG